MIQLPLENLHPEALAQLDSWQAEIDHEADYEKRVQRGKDSFSAKNTANNVTFQQVKFALTQMCCGSRRCHYCEDSVADEVEHLKPKDLYPENVFSWENYLYSCGPCNNGKNNKFSVICPNTRACISVTRPPKAPVIPPLSGALAIINVRSENPEHFLFLDLQNFRFEVLPGIEDDKRKRAEYTLEVLRLNERSYLVNTRKDAYHSYFDALSGSVAMKLAGASSSTIAGRGSQLGSRYHRSVWTEMKRQRKRYSNLQNLFTQLPEALSW